MNMVIILTLNMVYAAHSYSSFEKYKIAVNKTVEKNAPKNPTKKILFFDLNSASMNVGTTRTPTMPVQP